MRRVVPARSVRWIAALAACALTACSMGWKSGWEMDREKPMKGSPDVEVLRQAARDADVRAENRASVEAMAKAWVQVLRAVPDDYEALVNLASTWTLLGQGYARTVGEQGEMYRKALQYAERAMTLDAGFREKVEGGTETWDAIPVLGAVYADAIGWWATAMMRMYHDCLSGVVQETRKEWIRRDEAVLAHLQSLAPGWNGGLAAYDRAVTAAAMPARAGGDIEKAGALFQEAIDASPETLRNRWGRARYLAVEKKDREAFRADLQWVAGRDAKAAPGSHGWNFLYQREAATMLSRESDWFW